MNALNQSWEHHSIFEGINDDLVLHFAKEELLKHKYISKKELQEIAKRKALKQKLQWMIQDMTMGLTLFGIVGAIFLSIYLAYSL